MAVVYNPYDDMMFSAAAGQGAYMNGEKIMSSEEPLSDQLACFGSIRHTAGIVMKEQSYGIITEIQRVR